MSTLKLNSMHCIKLQDSISEDEIEIRVNGVKVAGPIGIHKNAVVNLGPIVRTFTGNVKVQLVELDGNHTPDDLGTETVFDTPISSVNLEFSRATHADYTVNYTVI